MKTLSDHIEYIKGKPHHIRKRVAFATAAFGSGLVALVWFVGSYATGSFAIHGDSFAVGTDQQNAVVTTSDTASQNLAGVAAALEDAKSPAHIEIVDTMAGVASNHQSEQTTLPF